jgi:hypothetical protein
LEKPLLNALFPSDTLIRGVNMGKTKELDKKIKDLENVKAYAEYKIKVGDLGHEFDNWVNNIERTIEILKARK